MSKTETLEKLLLFAFVMSENMVGLTKGNYDEDAFVKKTYAYLHKYNVDLNSKLELEKALQRLEAIDNSNPSEALKTLEVLDKTISPLLEPVLAEYEDDLGDTITANYFALKQSLIKAQENTRSEEILQKYYQEGITLDSVRALKQERDNYKNVLNIINEKNVDIIAIKESKTLEEYNRNTWEVEHYGKYKGYKLQLTQEEFDTLKEWTR